MWKLHPLLGPGDLLVGYRGLCSFAHLAMLTAGAVAGLFRMHQRQIVDFARVARRMILQSGTGEGRDFAELKTTLKMRRAKSQTTEGVRKELAVYALVYNLVQPAQQGGLQGLRLETVEDTLEGVVRRDAVGQFQEGLQPVQAFVSEGFDIGPGVGASDDGADGKGEDVAQQVTLAAVEAGIFETANVLVQRQT